MYLSKMYWLKNVVANMVAEGSKAAYLLGKISLVPDGFFEFQISNSEQLTNVVNPKIPKTDRSTAAAATHRPLP